MITGKHSENHAVAKAMAAIEKRFSETKMSTTVITQAEFQAVNYYIESLEHELQMLACENHSLLSQEIQPEMYGSDSCADLANEETFYIQDRHDQALQAVRTRWESLQEISKQKLVMK